MANEIFNNICIIIRILSIIPVISGIFVFLFSGNYRSDAHDNTPIIRSLILIGSGIVMFILTYVVQAY